MRYTDYLRWGAVSALFLALFVLFIRAFGSFWPNLFFPYITGKNFAFRLLVEIAIGCYILLALKEPKYRPKLSGIMWAVAAFVGWMAIATFFSVDPDKSFWSNFERMEGYIGLLHLFAWFVVAGAVLTADKLWNAFFNTSIGISAIQGMWALFQVLGWAEISTQSGARADTTFGNATYLAVYLLINFFLTLYMLARVGKSSSAHNYRLFYAAALLLQLLGIFFSETRGAILGLGAGLTVAALYYLLFARGPETKTLRKYAFGALALVIVFAGFIYAVRDTAFVKEIPALRRLASISLNETTVASRLQYIWPMAIKGAQERPLTGWGQENFNFVFNKNYDPGMYNQEQWFDRAHNQFLDWLIAGGVPAFLLYISLYVLAVWAIFRAAHLTAGEKAAFMGLLAAYAFNNMFVFDNLVSGIYFFALLAFFHSLIAEQKPSLSLSKPASDHVVAIAAPVVLVATLLTVWSANAAGFERAKMLVSAIQTQEAGVNSTGAVVGVQKDPKKNLAEFQTALGPVQWPGGTLGIQEATEQFLQYASSMSTYPNLDPQTKLDLFGSAADAITRLLEERPGDARLELFASTFFIQYGQVQPAIDHIEKALALSPRKQQIQIQAGLTLIQAGDPAGAADILRQAFEAAPEYDAARIFYAAGLYASNRTADADALLTERFGSPIIDNPQLLQVFMTLKMYDRAVEVWKIRVAADPKNTDTRLGLAAVYFAACRNNELVAELQEIARINPNSALEMQNLIKQIQDGTLKCGL